MVESRTDHSILKKIEGLVHEEQHLYGLRQRDARREFGQDPNDAKVRPPTVVERYKQ